MPGKSKGKRFASQAEEAKWREANEAAIADKFEKAAVESRVDRCTLVVTGDSTVTKIRLGARDVAKGRAQAAERGARFEAYVRTIIHEALRATERRRKTATE